MIFMYSVHGKKKKRHTRPWDVCADLIPILFYCYSTCGCGINLGNIALKFFR